MFGRTGWCALLCEPPAAICRRRPLIDRSSSRLMFPCPPSDSVPECRGLEANQLAVRQAPACGLVRGPPGPSSNRPSCAAASPGTVFM